jgi:hypothetical protein
MILRWMLKMWCEGMDCIQLVQVRDK